MQHSTRFDLRLRPLNARVIQFDIWEHIPWPICRAGTQRALDVVMGCLSSRLASMEFDNCPGPIQMKWLNDIKMWFGCKIMFASTCWPWVKFDWYSIFHKKVVKYQYHNQIWIFSWMRSHITWVASEECLALLLAMPLASVMPFRTIPMVYPRICWINNTENEKNK